MLSTATLSLNPIALTIWISLAFSSFTILTLFSIALYYYYRHHKEANVEHDQQPPRNPNMPPNYQILHDLLQQLMHFYNHQQIQVRMNNPLAIQ